MNFEDVALTDSRSILSLLANVRHSLITAGEDVVSLEGLNSGDPAIELLDKNIHNALHDLDIAVIKISHRE